jgi:Flp pilus assembly protein TadG
VTRAMFARLRRNERGASIIELALVAPFLAALVMGITDLSRAYSTKLLLEQAAQRTIERVEQQKSVASTYNTALSTEAGNAMTDAGYSTGNTITADSWLECGTSTTHLTFSSSCASSSDTVARYVSVRIARDYVPFFSSRAWPGANASGNIPVSGYAEVRIQ